MFIALCIGALLVIGCFGAAVGSDSVLESGTGANADWLQPTDEQIDDESMLADACDPYGDSTDHEHHH